ncbi:MAG: 50S ribosomal protein L21 [Spirulina sp. SIO3F2]|nr:50S ribosomal protein L21 [Spirulina sp. SIO3F2]
MTYAIVETGGKQLRVEPGRFYDVELLHEDEGAGYSIDKVLLISDDDEIKVGQPYVEGATVEGYILRHFRGKKVIVYKMQPKKKTRKKRGHRQEQTRFIVSAININGEAIAAADVGEYINLNGDAADEPAVAAVGTDASE